MQVHVEAKGGILKSCRTENQPGTEYGSRPSDSFKSVVVSPSGPVAHWDIIGAKCFPFMVQIYCTCHIFFKPVLSSALCTFCIWSLSGTFISVAYSNKAHNALYTRQTFKPSADKTYWPLPEILSLHSCGFLIFMMLAEENDLVVCLPECQSVSNVLWLNTPASESRKPNPKGTTSTLFILSSKHFVTFLSLKAEKLASPLMASGDRKPNEDHAPPVNRVKVALSW